MSDYAGAASAIQAAVVAEWTEIPTTYPNAAGFEPPKDVDGVPLPWGLLEVLPTFSEVLGTGTQKTYAYYGVIVYHVFVPLGTGLAEANRMAVAVGEIFRTRKLYDNGDGCYVRTVSPSIIGSSGNDDNGNWFRVTMTVDFTYWHLI
jgi:hypothetical protein